MSTLTSWLGYREAKFTEMQQSVSSVKAELITERDLHKTSSEALTAEAEEKECKEVQKALEKNLLDKTAQEQDEQYCYIWSPRGGEGGAGAVLKGRQN